MNKELPSVYQSIIHRSRYARFLQEEKRRESYEETVDRYINYMYQQCKKQNITKENLHVVYLLLGATCEE